MNLDSARLTRAGTSQRGVPTLSQEPQTGPAQ